MQKPLLTLAIIAAVLPAYGSDAQKDPITSVEGSISRYSSSVYWIHEGNSYKDEGIIASICTAPDSTAVYIRDLMPAWEEGWLAGTISDDGLHFPSGQLVSKWGIGDIYMGAAVTDRRTGNYNTIDEFILTNEEGGGYRLADRNGETVYILAYLHDGTLLEADYSLVLTPFDSTEAEPPADAETSLYTRVYFDGVSKFPYSDVVTVACKGDDLWLEGFNGHESGFVTGTMTETGDIFIPTGQYTGMSGAYASYMFSGEKDPSTGAIDETSGLTLRKKDSEWASGQYGTLMFGFNKDHIEYRHNNFVLTPYVESGVSTITKEEKECTGTEYFDLTGRKISGPCEGFYIVTRHYSDGTRESVKQSGKAASH